MQKYAIIRKNTKYIYIFYHSKRKSNYREFKKQVQKY